MRIRLCKEQDIPQILKLGKSDFKGEDRKGWYKAKYLKQILRENPKTCWVLEDKGKIKGVRFVFDDSDGRAWGWLLAVHKDLRDHGVGTTLFKYTAKKLKEKGFRKLYAECDSESKMAVNWHLKVGYKKIGLFRDWFGKGRHAVVFDYDL